MSQQGIYSEDKLVWWYARERGLPKAPIQVQLILSALCNQDCHFCAYRMSGYTSNQLFMGDAVPAAKGHNNPTRWMPTQRALDLISEIGGLNCLSVQFTGGGEPTVHPHHEQIFESALGHGLRCSLVSNGIRWSDELIRDILPRFDWVRVSIDAGDPESYARIRRSPVAHWSKAWTHVSSLAWRKPASCQLGAGFVVTPESYKQIPEFAHLAREQGADNCRFTAMFSAEDESPFVEIYDEICDLIAKARLSETPKFTVYDNFGSRFSDLAQHAPDYSNCGYQHYTTYIGDDLKVYRCCVLAYNKRGLVADGDLTNQSFETYWKSKARKEDMGTFDARGCERCQFNAKNRALNYVMQDRPEHVEWP
jgi:MoaA/NifB/PqqE/SkfB family radical SAM enzyme